ncbi:MAG TPA: hypothetical protein VG052_05785 [Puia sp.]|jgi:hypothetical protein|nr:hypothetical protein [Puia sp.]
MNTNTKNHTVKAIAIALTAFVILFSSPLTSKANDGGSKKSSSTADAQVSVTYQGVSDNSLVFKVDYENPTAEKFWLIIKNDNGDVVYHHEFSSAHFAKSIVFQNTDTEINPTFVIRTAGNTDIVRQFQVSKILTETTLVTGL